MKRRGFSIFEVIIMVGLMAMLFIIAVGNLNRPHRTELRSLAGVMEASYPAPTGYVVDEAGILSEVTETEISVLAKDLAAGDGPEVAVVTVVNIEPETMEEYAIKLAERWQVGKAGIDNGVILLVVPSERKLRIEVGRGAEAVLTDAEAQRIVDKTIVPFFKRGDMDSGIRAGVAAIVAELKEAGDGGHR